MKIFALPLGAYLALGSSSAFGATCIDIQEEQDQLSADDRSAALFLIKESVADYGGEVAGECTESWVLTHIKLGQSITVSAVSESQRLKLTVTGRESLPDAYAQIAKSMVTGDPIAHSRDRSNVTNDQVNENRVEAEFMSTFGFGGTTALYSSSGMSPTLIPGMRVELDRWAIDISGRGYLSTSEDNSGLFGLSGHLTPLYFFDPRANHSLYAGPGIGYSTLAVAGDNGAEIGSGNGFDLQGVVGYEFFRASTIRIYTQANVSLPLYEVSSESWSPVMTFSLGFGWKPEPGHHDSVPWWAFLL